MKTGVLTDPYGNLKSAVIAKSAPPLDANHIYAYDCNEISGSTVLVNKGSNSGGNLTLQGVEGTNYALGQAVMGRNTKCIRNLTFGSGGSNGGAISGAVSFSSASGFTLEIVACTDLSQWSSALGQTGSLMYIGNGSEYFTVLSTYYPQIPRGAALINGFGSIGTPGIITYIPNNGGMAHIMCTFDPSNTSIKQYINGALIDFTTPTTANNYVSPFTAISIGTSTNDGTFSGWFMYARISNIVRSAAYASQTAEAFLAM